MMHCGPERTFKNMEEVSSVFKLKLNYENTDIKSVLDIGGNGTEKRKSFTLENENNKGQSLSLLQSVSDETNSHELSQINGELTQHSLQTCLKPNNVGEFAEELSEARPTTTQLKGNCSENKENTTVPSTSITPDNNQEEDRLDQRSVQDSSAKTQHNCSEDLDTELTKIAQEEGCVNVIFPGTVTQDGCCRFVSEILKCILYQRQQLPMTYDQLVYSQKKQQAALQDKDVVNKRPVKSTGIDWRKSEQTLQELEEVLQHLEVLFSLSRVPRVLLLMGGSLVLPKEMYEINMEALVQAAGDKCLRVSSCLRQLFRTLFVADLLSDPRPVRLMPTTVLVLAHRDCGVGWFRPKLHFKVPTQVKNKVIALSTDLCSCKELKMNESDWQDYVWFQAPMTIKGFSN